MTSLLPVVFALSCSCKHDRAEKSHLRTVEFVFSIQDFTGLGVEKSLWYDDFDVELSSLAALKKEKQDINFF